jgi:hypothetical protein
MCPQRPLEDGEGDGEGVVGADGLADGEGPAVGVPWWWLNFSTYVTAAAAITSTAPTATSSRSLRPPLRARLPRGGPPAAGAAVSFSAVVLAAGAPVVLAPAVLAPAALAAVAAATGAARPGQDDADPVASSSAGQGWIDGTSMDGG